MNASPKEFKPQYGWSVSLLLPITPTVANFFYRHHISANTVSWLSLAVFCVGLFFYIACDSVYCRVAAVLLFTLGTLLDVVDGYVARLNFAKGNYGAYLDAGIDILRYNLFFIAVVYVNSLALIEILVVSLYVFLLNISFMKLFININRGRSNKFTNTLYEKHLPAHYKNFCLRYKLLHNPFNLEDQLLFFIFVIGVLFGWEVYVIGFCLIIRVMEVFYAISKA